MKNKPSAKLKNLKKGTKKKSEAKALVKAGSKQHLSDAPPLPPPEEAPPAEEAPSAEEAPPEDPGIPFSSRKL